MLKNAIFAYCIYRREYMSITDHYQLYKHAWVYAHDPSEEQPLSRKQCRELLQHGGWMVRNVYHFDKPQPGCFWYVIKDSFNGMQEVPSKYRGYVRKALEYYDIRHCDKSFIQEHGYKVYWLAQERYIMKQGTMLRQEFNLMLQQHDSSWEYWCAVDKSTGEMVAFSMNKVNAISCNYSTLKAIPSHMRLHYVYYGLIYEMNAYYLQQRGLQYVSDGARSVTNHSHIQPFLMQKFQFRQAYCDIRITYVFWLKALIYLLYPLRNIMPHAGLKALLNMESMQRTS